MGDRRATPSPTSTMATTRRTVLGDISNNLSTSNDKQPSPKVLRSRRAATPTKEHAVEKRLSDTFHDNVAETPSSMRTMQSPIRDRLSNPHIQPKYDMKVL